MRYKYLFIAIAVPAIFAIAPSVSTASTGTGAAVSSTVTIRTCTTLNAFAEKTINVVSGRAMTLEKDRASRLDQLVAQWADQDAQTMLARQQADQTKTADFAALETSLADAPASQKQALATFEASLNSAAATRQSAVDTATQAFRTGVEAALQMRSSSLQSAIDDFTRSLQGSLDMATANCSGTAVPTSLQGNLKTGLQAARQAFQKDPRLAAAGPVDLSSLTNKYQAAMQAATAAFRSEVLGAQVAFKASLAS